MMLSIKEIEIGALIDCLLRLGKELGVDPNAILATSHGRRSIDVLKLYDEEKANWKCE